MAIKIAFLSIFLGKVKMTKEAENRKYWINILAVKMFAK
jgi:hypothetical protein